MSSMRDTNLAYGAGEHPVHGTWLSVDVVALTEDSPARISLVTRKGTPHRGSTTLPGGLLAAWDGETVVDAAIRIVRDKVGVEVVDGAVAILDVVSDPNRDERGHTVSILVVVRIPAGTPGAVPLGDVPAGMPFRHNMLLDLGLRRLRERLLVERDTTLAVLGSVTTVPRVTDVMRGIFPRPLTDSGVRSRMDRSGIYIRDENRVLRPRIGRPQSVYYLSPQHI